ncbi:hypothetical protein PUN28_014610 [Cardiocondyla obscurior]|uniref:Uncharacterized protein n=1 Tax=Cardiocondyla obscurior TaxID=286306 RepID=A0AAW2F0Y9_9HYME
MFERTGDKGRSLDGDRAISRGPENEFRRKRRRSKSTEHDRWRTRRGRGQCNPLLLVQAARAQAPEARGVNDKSSRHEHRAFSWSAASPLSRLLLPSLTLSRTFLSRAGGSVPLVNMS